MNREKMTQIMVGSRRCCPFTHLIFPPPMLKILCSRELNSNFVFLHSTGVSHFRLAIFCDSFKRITFNLNWIKFCEQQLLTQYGLQHSRYNAEQCILPFIAFVVGDMHIYSPCLREAMIGRKGRSACTLTLRSQSVNYIQTLVSICHQFDFLYLSIYI